MAGQLTQIHIWLDSELPACFAQIHEAAQFSFPAGKICHLKRLTIFILCSGVLPLVDFHRDVADFDGFECFSLRWGKWPLPGGANAGKCSQSVGKYQYGAF